MLTITRSYIFTLNLEQCIICKLSDKHVALHTFHNRQCQKDLRTQIETLKDRTQSIENMLARTQSKYVVNPRLVRILKNYLIRPLSALVSKLSMGSQNSICSRVSLPLGTTSCRSISSISILSNWLFSSSYMKEF